MVALLKFAPEYEYRWTEDPRNRLLHNTIAKLENCSQAAWLCSSENGHKAHVCVSRCKHRVCPTCIEQRHRWTTWRCGHIVKQFKEPRFLTLTLRSSDDCIEDQLRFAMKSFAKFRRSKWFKRRCIGGVYNLQVTYSHKRDQYHPHIHIIMDSSFMKHEEIEQKWLEITGHSSIVWIEQVKDTWKNSGHLAHYITSHDDIMTLPPHRVCDWIEGTKSVRCLSTFGKYHGALKKLNEELPRVKMERIASLVPIKAASLRGDEEAKKIMWLVSELQRSEYSVSHEEIIHRTNKWIETDLYLNHPWRFKEVQKAHVTSADYEEHCARPPDPPGLF